MRRWISGNARAGWGAALLVLAVVVAFANTLHAPFVFDDRAAILDNATLRRPGDLGQVLSPPSDGRAVAGRPLVNLSFALNYAWSGTDPWSYHAVNLAVHALAALLLFGILRRTVPTPPFLAFAVALLWSVHPLVTESVTCVVQRTESLAGLCYLLTLYAFIRGSAAVESSVAAAGGRGRAWRIVSVIAALAGMASKETMVTAPLLVLLYDRTFVAGTFRAAWRQRRGYYLALGATWLLLAALVLRGGGVRGTAAGFGTDVSSWDYLLKQCEAIVLYLRLALWPHPLVLDYGPATPITIADVWWQGIVVLALLGATAWALVRRPRLGFAGAWFFVILAPSSSFVPLPAQTMAEHRMYLSLAAVLVAVAVAVQAVAGRRTPVVFLALAVAAGTATWRRNEVYRSERALWADTVVHAPANGRALGNLGGVLLEAGEVAEALPVLERAVRAAPNAPEILANLCLAEARSGRLADAVVHGEAALQLEPGHANARVNLAYALYRMGNAHAAAKEFGAALATYERALLLDPANATARNNLANVLLVTGRTGRAIAEYREALRLRPDDASIRENLERALEAEAAEARKRGE